MKTWEQLTKEQKEVALKRQVDRTLENLCEYGAEWFPEIEEKFNAAVAEMKRMRTPWFLAEALFERAENEITELAMGNCEMYLYAEPSDPLVIYGVIK